MSGFELVVAIVFLGALPLAGLLQLIIVPATASSRGKDGGVWFLITVVWLVLFWGFSCAGGLFILGGISSAAQSLSSGDAEEAAVSLVSMAVCFLIAAFCLFIEYLPLIAVRITGKKPMPPVRGRRRREPEVRPRHRRSPGRGDQGGARGGAPKARKRREPTEESNLAKCVACGGQVSLQADACPHCGHPLR